MQIQAITGKINTNNQNNAYKNKDSNRERVDQPNTTTPSRQQAPPMNERRNDVTPNKAPESSQEANKINATHQRPFTNLSIFQQKKGSTFRS